MLSRCAHVSKRALTVSTKAAPGGLVSEVVVTVKGAGSKSGPAGLAHVVAASAFLDTSSKSALRLKREAELLGGEYSASVTRDDLVLKATFLKESLPFFVNAIGGALAEAAHKPHELTEVALPYAKYVAAQANACPTFRALEELHAVSFRSGLGKPLYYDGSKSFSAEDVAAFAKTHFTSENVAVEGTNVEEADLAKFVGESPLSKLHNGNAVVAATPKTYTGAETRIRAAGASAAVIGVPVADATGSAATALQTALAAVDGAAVGVSQYDGAALVYASVSGAPAHVAQTLAALAKAAAKDYNLVVVGDIDALPLKAEL